MFAEGNFVNSCAKTIHAPAAAHNHNQKARLSDPSINFYQTPARTILWDIFLTKVKNRYEFQMDFLLPFFDQRRTNSWPICTKSRAASAQPLGLNSLWIHRIISDSS